MSRSGYVEDYENVELYRRAVRNAIKGKRGQALLRDMLAGLDALPEKRLIAGAMIDKQGEVCALGAAGVHRNRDMSEMTVVSEWDDEPEMDIPRVTAAFDVADCLAREVAFVNDEANYQPETPEQRWARVRGWVVRNITALPAPEEG